MLSAGPSASIASNLDFDLLQVKGRFTIDLPGTPPSAGRFRPTRGVDMLGDLISEERGQVTGTRVLPAKPGELPAVEVSFEANGRMFGTDAKEIGTYTSTQRPDGTLVGEGHGITTTRDGDVVSWRGSGVGRITETGSTVFRGALIFQTEAHGYVRLNGVLGVFEYEEDESGKTEAKTWEWK
jgi:hypothetical protein